MKRVLIANRGEIAIRVIRACRELGLETVAVYPEVDQASAHVAMADQAVMLSNRRGYLDIPLLIEAARQSKADAIHPGYGFLAENEAFAAACRSAGLTFIGPSPETIAAMGVKTVARQKAREAGVPVVPGTDALPNREAAILAAAAVGYPLLVKAAGGGGGRGIRQAAGPEELVPVLEAAQREAELAFGSSEVYLERLLQQARHIEVQVLGDRHGNVIHLAERECSLQRRRQKIVEESPSTAVSPDLRHRLGEAAVRLARAVHYEGAGTVEFLLDQSGDFYFLEMNTRIQVEHGVTEAITGVDLVKEQLRIAAGEPLSLTQEQVVGNGVAIECRINAEDPTRSFAPSPGKVERFVPPLGPWVRVDTAMYSGGAVSPYFDSLVAKVIVWGRDRPEAIERMRQALHELELSGVKSTRDLCLAIIADPEFVAGRTHVGLVESRLSELLESAAR